MNRNQINHFSVCFYTRKSKSKSKEKLKVYARITFAGVRRELSVHLSVAPELWDSVRSRAKGSSSTAMRVNSCLVDIENALYKHYTELKQSCEPFSVEDIRSRYCGEDTNIKTFIQLLDEFISYKKELVGSVIQQSTFNKYNALAKHLRSYVPHKYGKNDIAMSKIDYAFVTGFDRYLRSVHNTGNNTTVKHIKNFGVFLKDALKKGYIKYNPVEDYEGKFKSVSRKYLRKEEIIALIQVESGIDRIQRVRDVFLFCCFTGLSFSDVKALHMDHVYQDSDGTWWLNSERKKTKNNFLLVLLPQALVILDKYRHHPLRENEGLALPVLSNQNYNLYLKELAVAAGIDKELTTHMARHTFATTITLESGVSMDVVSKLLGHTSIKSTRIYAKMLPSRIGREMSQINNLDYQIK